MVDSSDVNQEYPCTSPFLGIHAPTALVHPCTSAVPGHPCPHGISTSLYVAPLRESH